MEAALAEELGEIAQQSTTMKVHNQVPGGVHCSGDLTDSYRINLHSRIASRVLMRMAHSSYANENDIYDLVLAQPWEDWFDVDHTIRVDVTAVKSPLRSLEFTTLKIKDADLRPLPRPVQQAPVGQHARAGHAHRRLPRPAQLHASTSTPPAKRCSSAAGAKRRATRRCARTWPPACCACRAGSRARCCSTRCAARAPS